MFFAAVNVFSITTAVPPSYIFNLSLVVAVVVTLPELVIKVTTAAVVNENHDIINVDGSGIPIATIPNTTIVNITFNIINFNKKPTLLKRVGS